MYVYVLSAGCPPKNEATEAEADIQGETETEAAAD